MDKVLIKLKEPLPKDLFTLSDEEILKDLNDFHSFLHVASYVTAVLGFNADNFMKHFSIELKMEENG